MEYCFGNIPDTPDKRDRKYEPIATKEILPKVDLRKQMPKIEDQRKFPTCTACAVVGIIEHLQLKNGTKKEHDMSRIFVYFNGRKIYLAETGSTNIFDVGLTVRAAIKAVADSGVCPEPKWPYTAKSLAQKPNQQAYDSAKDRLITEYNRIILDYTKPDYNINQIQAALTEGYPIAYGMRINLSFMKTKRDGIMQIPTLNENGDVGIGSHTMVICGYNENYFIIRNSWGQKWGDKGYLYMPYEYLRKYPYFTWDYWIIKAMTKYS